MKRTYKILGLFCLLVTVNFIIFVIISFFLGGNAVNGKVENGHYYLWGYSVITGVKGYTEVNKLVFYYSKWHLYVTFICLSVTFMFTLFFRKGAQSLLKIAGKK
jgi:hypothetical protein